MKRIALLFVGMLVTLIALAQKNYFEEGTSWIMQYSYLDQDNKDVTGYTEMWIEGTTPISGKVYLNVWSQKYDNEHEKRIGSETDKSLVTFLYVEGNKVYSFNYGNSSQPALIFDFDLNVGDKCNVNACYPSFLITSNLTQEPRTSTLEYLESETMEYNGNSFTKMLFKEDATSQPFYSKTKNTESKFSGHWIQGIGYTGNPLHNCVWKYAGGSSHLVKVKSHGETILDLEAIRAQIINSKDDFQKNESTPIYNLNGKRSSENEKGILISAGKKYISK